MSVPDMINALLDDNKIEAESSFKNAISQKIGDALDLKRIQVANSLVTQHVTTTDTESEEV
jgi:hypothetical protein|tara:strand:- start:305 stop:487 length:183 start_codon:yes stop_codon:yes gene_type:complete